MATSQQRECGLARNLHAQHAGIIEEHPPADAFGLVLADHAIQRLAWQLDRHRSVRQGFLAARPQFAFPLATGDQTQAGRRARCIAVDLQQAQ
ncbi:hypothetical protein [Pseudofulvimonas gallinarii]|uniref:hypothetical protein n=1 Tax=Pseudofulvimonas gallinarii TaxID=634155 RepID=UPI000F4AE63C|nr:hypothetical protein [Pseudofulvimonas gallinarii]